MLVYFDTEVNCNKIKKNSSTKNKINFQTNILYTGIFKQDNLINTFISSSDTRK